MNDIIKQLLAAGIGRERIRENEPMDRHTSFRAGGRAALFLTLESEAELGEALRLIRAAGVPHLLLGNGSNILFSDRGYEGIVLVLGESFREIQTAGTMVSAGGAALLSRVSAAAAENGLSGMEFASGIPGSIGGAVFMNAGAYGGEMKDIVRSARLMAPDGSRTEVWDGGELDFTYRHSVLQENGWIVLSAELVLEEGERGEIRERIRELTEKRNLKQPVNFPSAGSTFKRPAGGYAAALIEDAGLKGVSVGGAEVSEKHSGFIINRKDATATDILELMRLVRRRVLERSGILLEPEVRIIGEEL